MDGKLPKISFLKLQGRGALITSKGWMGIDVMDLDQKIIKIFLMRGQFFFTSLELGY